MKKNKFEAFILGSYLDTIGFLNGYMEFNDIIQPTNNKIMGEYVNFINIMNFFKIGGFNLNLKNYKASDDTILNIANGKVLIKNKFKISDFIDSYLNYYDILLDNRYLGIQLKKSLKNLKKTRSYLSITYDKSVLGNGAVMRSCIFGLKYNYKEDLFLLYKWVTDTSKLTHNNYKAYVPALICAIFTSMAIEKIPPLYWLDEINEIKNNITFSDKLEVDFFNSILENLESILNSIIIFNSSNEYSLKYYNKPLVSFTKIFKNINIDNYSTLSDIGGISEDLIYFSFNIIINSFTMNKEAMKKYKKSKINIDDLSPNFIFLLINSSLSFGDSDTIGIVCGFWYGALFGFKDVPNINFEDLEFYNDIKKITDSL